MATMLLLVVALAGLIPTATATTGKWRNINPTEYTSIPNVQLNSIYVLNGGTSGIGSGNAWAVGRNGTIFFWDGFSWLNQSIGTPCSLNSVNFGSPFSLPMSPTSAGSSAGIIVGGGATSSGCPGRISLFWNGFSWFPYTGTGLNDARNLTSVFLVSANQNTGTSAYTLDAWAVGLNATAGAFYHFGGVPGAGGSWNEQNVADSSSTGCEVDSVYMVSATEGWAAGRCGKIYHYFGGNWQLAPGVSPSWAGAGVDWKSVFMDSTTDGWAVGSDNTIAHFTGGIWTCCIKPGGVVGTPTLRSVTFVSSSEAWAVGDAQTGGATIIHYANGQWTGLQPNQVPTLLGLNGAHATGGSNVWAVGQSGSILLWDGSIWGSITAPLQTNFNAVWMTGSSDGIAVGNLTSSGPTITKWDGVKWYRPQGGVSLTDLWGTWELNSGEWWVVGGGEGVYPYTARHAGSTLVPGAETVAPPTCPLGTPSCILLTSFGTASDNVWTAGTGGIIAHWTCPGGVCSWSGPVPLFTSLLNPTTTTWRSIAFVGGDPNKGWAVGFDSTPPTPLVYCYVNACSMVSSTPEQWESVGVPASVPANTRLNSVSTQLDNTNHVWIAGSNGVILLIDGNAGTITPTATVSSYNLTSIFVDSSTDGWAVGQDTATNLPVFVHYDGTGWNPVGTIPPFNNVGRLQSMYLLSGTDGFAVGTTAGANGIVSLGMMFHLDPPGGVYATTTITPIQTTSSTLVTSASTTSSVTSTSSSIVATSTAAGTATTTEVSTSVSTSVVSTTAMVTQTVTTSSSTTTPLVLPAIPGFPWESIIAGIVIGIALLGIARRNKRKTL